MEQVWNRRPPLLTKRLAALEGTKYAIPSDKIERAFAGQAVLDRVLVWQFPESWYGDDAYEGTRILKAMATEARHRQDTPRGIILSIGLGALDALRTNGMDVGHIVHFCVNAPYRRPLDDHQEHHLLLLRAGDMVDSEDLAKALDSGECKVVWDGTRHHLVDKDGGFWTPKLPWMED